MRRHGREGTQLREGENIRTTDVRRQHLHRKIFIEWEETKEKDKTWAKAKTYFDALYKARRSYESDMKAHRSSFETSNSFTQNPQNGSEQSTTERSTYTAATKATTKSPTSQWVEYSDSLEESLQFQLGLFSLFL